LSKLRRPMLGVFFVSSHSSLCPISCSLRHSKQAPASPCLFESPHQACRTVLYTMQAFGVCAVCSDGTPQRPCCRRHSTGVCLHAVERHKHIVAHKVASLQACYDSLASTINEAKQHAHSIQVSTPVAAQIRSSIGQVMELLRDREGAVQTTAHSRRCSK